MRKYVIMFFLICANAVFAQVVPDSVDLRSNSYCAEFENNAPARNKYEIAKKWFSTNLQNFRDIIVSEDARRCKIVLKPLVLYKADSYSRCYLATLLTFECDNKHFSLKFDNVKKRAAFSTMANIESADSVYLQSKLTTDIEIGKYRRYKELKAKNAPTAEELKEIRACAFFDNYTEDALRRENMVYYHELQNIVAEIVNKLKLTLEE
jgi:hypothetical protein